MRFIRLVRALAAGLLAVALVSAAGCPTSVEKADLPAAPTTAEPNQQPPADDSATMPRPPVGEFQQPPVLPTNDPLPSSHKSRPDVPAVPVVKPQCRPKSLRRRPTNRRRRRR